MHNKRSRAYRAFVVRALAVASLALVSGSGCTNNLLRTANDLLDASSSVSPNNVTSTGNGSGLTLTRVQKSASDPAGTLDLIGDGSGTMGSMCVPKSTTGSGSTSAGASTCTCAFTYINSAGSQIGPIEVDTTYRERDMIRCQYGSVVPTDISYFKVHVHQTSADVVSNEVTFRYTGTGVTMDPSNRDSFAQVQRFQCRDIVTIPYLWDNAIYDPILSEDPRYSYPLNFYTTNMGRTLASYAGGAGGITAPLGWHCPAIPNDNSAGMDLTLFSVAADSTGSKAIFPPAGAFDRSTFFVAKAKSGVFNVAVNAYAFPGAYTTTAAATSGSGLPPLGYAARPLPLSAGGETCPDTSTTIPPGFHWAKLWLFRKQLPQRSYPSSHKLAQLGQIACNPRPWNPASTGLAASIYGDCSASGTPTTEAPDSNGLAARFFEGTGMCHNVLPGGVTNPAGLANFTSFEAGHPKPGVDFSGFAKGTDVLYPRNTDPSYGCTGSSPMDPARTCNSSTGNVAYDSSIPLPQGAIDASVSNPRFDYLFVVTPVSVNRADMDPTSSSSTHQVYTPLRFMSPNDCKSADPDSPLTPGDCSPTRMLRYDLKKHEVGSPGNPGSDDPNRAGDFPLCVLQPN